MFQKSLTHFSPEDCVITVDFTESINHLCNPVLTEHAQQTVDATQGDMRTALERAKLQCLTPKTRFRQHSLFLWRWGLRRHENFKNADFLRVSLLVETQWWPNFVCFGSWANKCEQSLWCPLKPLQRRHLILAHSFDTLWGLQYCNERKISTKPEIKGWRWMC